LQDFGVQFDTTSVLCDNTSAINLFKNSILYSRTKNIDVRNHFLKNHVKCRHILLEFIGTTINLLIFLLNPCLLKNFAIFAKNWAFA